MLLHVSEEQVTADTRHLRWRFVPASLPFVQAFGVTAVEAWLPVQHTPGKILTKTHFVYLFI